MRTHTYWKTYEEYLKWSFNPPKQINVKGVASASRVHIKFIYGGFSPVSPLYGGVSPIKEVNRDTSPQRGLMGEYPP